ncbi:MAG: bifunctional sugar-1-phosphate nucleotidylyltransferase/acetyltransferase [Methanotrichaceae archaeon]
MMQAIVLAAGEGSRMRPLTSKLPKVMLPIAGRPLLEHIITRAHKAGADNIVLVIGYGADFVKSHFQDGNSLGIKIEYAVQEKQMGTGDALLAAKAYASDRFLVLNGDILPDTESLRIMILSDEESVAARQVSDPKRYGVFLEENGYMKSVIEKSPSPPSSLANAGIYLFNRSIFDCLSQIALSERGEYELTDALNILAQKERIRIVELKEWMEIGRPWDILTANEALLKNIEPKIEGVIEPGATLNGNISIGKGTIIRSGAYITGPVIIGKECDIGPNCYVRPSTCIGNKVRIGNAVEIKNSTIMDGTKIGHLSYVGDSIIGSDSNLGAGTICSNLRHDKRNIRSFIKGERMDSGRRKLGAIMGDSVKTGIHTTIYPGTVIESGFRGLPAAVLKGFVSGKVYV